ncbi:hypothetical protein GCM10027317_44700 [Massilia agri]
MAWKPERSEMVVRAVAAWAVCDRGTAASMASNTAERIILESPAIDEVTKRMIIDPFSQMKRPGQRVLAGPSSRRCDQGRGGVRIAISFTGGRTISIGIMRARLAGGQAPVWR